MKALGSPQLRATCRHKLANCSALPHEIGHICFSGEAGKETVLPLPNLLLSFISFFFPLMVKKQHSSSSTSFFYPHFVLFQCCRGRIQFLWVKHGTRVLSSGRDESREIKFKYSAQNIFFFKFWKSVWNSSCAEEHWELKLEDVFYSEKNRISRQVSLYFRTCVLCVF